MSDRGELLFTGIVLVVIVALLGAFIFLGVTPAGRTIWNNWWHDVQVADDNSNYETLKHVEDTCRAMISSYESDKLTYEQYKDSEDADERSWAAQAKMRANKTAVEYNNYILKNRYIWKNNVPADIYGTLATIE